MICGWLNPWMPNTGMEGSLWDLNIGILVSYPGLRTNPRWLPREDYINKRKYICNILHLMPGGIEMPSPIVATIPRATEIKNKCN